MIAVDWSVNGSYDIAVALENENHALLIGSLCGSIFFVTIIQRRS
ncbi:hypothetical protein M917_0744 [Psychrobacter aquaticus CMS 56]|uniref:Uncharacterized protein n=1 Tax=Psychrobacter aquaticus CMS 56 TaxID=1354303 RepID=U4T8K4_9GAMM|nr:hypothetical protein M917_0744 [Psychrobacter aquaticus CMS 56]